MNSNIYIPNNLRAAGSQLRTAFRCDLAQMSKRNFTNIWCAVSYLFPGLNPDGFEESGSGWPVALKRIADEAWKRAERGELADEELYPADSAWAGIYDRMMVHFPSETERRLELANQYGQAMTNEI